MYTNFIRSSVSLMGGIYLGNVVYKKAKEENSSSIIHKLRTGLAPGDDYK